MKITQDLKAAILEPKRSNDAREIRMNRRFLKMDHHYKLIISTILTVGVVLFTAIAKGFH